MTRNNRTGLRMGVTGALAAALVLVAAILVLNPEAGQAPRRWVKTIDYAVLGGGLHRVLTGDSVTEPSALVQPPPPPGAYDWAEPGGFLAIAHGLGPSLETGRNTLATFRRGLQAGFTVFEVDLTLTSDGVLACYHGRAGEDPDTLTWAGIKKQAPGGCRFEELVDAAAAHPELRFVLDVKNRFEDAYDRIRILTDQAGVTAAFIPQVYHFAQLTRFRRSPGFAGALFTAYRSALATGQVLEFARQAGVPVVTLSVERVEAWEGAFPPDPLILVHPVNDPYLAQRLKARGVDGIYTGYVTPAAAPALYR